MAVLMEDWGGFFCCVQQNSTTNVFFDLFQCKFSTLQVLN